MNPAISVILPVFNAAPYVEEAVQSILEQSYENFELLILNDGSTDASGKILGELAKKDTRIRLVQRENKGLIATLNEGLSLARAPLIARMDADDISLPSRLSLQLEHMNGHPDVVVVGGAIRYVDSVGNVGHSVVYPTKSTVDAAILWGAPVAHPATMFRTEVARSVGGYPPTFPCAEDYAFWLRLRNWGCIDNLPQVVLHYRLHGQSASHVHALKQRTSTLRAQALWLAKSKPIDAIMSIQSNVDFLEALPLSPTVHIEILARMVALSPHLIGDEVADTETALWLRKVQQAAQTPCLRQGRAWFHLRASRFCRNEPLRRLMHLWRAVLASPSACITLLGKRLRPGSH